MTRSTIHRHRRLSFGRRALLQGLAGTAAVAPFVPLLQAETESGYPTRFVWLWQPGSPLYDEWVPQGTETDFTLGPLLAPLEDHIDQLVVLGGLSLNYGGDFGGGHYLGTRQMAGSRINGGTPENHPPLPFTVSVDQFIAERVAPATVYPSISLGAIHNNDPAWPLCVDGAQQPVALENSPAALFDALFAGFSDDELAVARRRAQRKSVIDAVLGHLGTMRPRYGGEDRLKVEAHLDALRALESANSSSATCDSPPVLDLDFDPMAHDNFPVVVQRQMDLLVKALACDLTRVGGIQLSSGSSGLRHHWAGVELDHHCSIEHLAETDPERRADQRAICLWYAEQFAYLLDALAAVPEGDGTLLDHTVVLHMHELGNGTYHTNYPQPFLLAGGANGQLQGHRFLGYEQGTWHNRLLVSLCHMMGIAGQATFGNEDNDTGGLVGLL